MQSTYLQFGARADTEALEYFYYLKKKKTHTFTHVKASLVCYAYRTSSKISFMNCHAQKEVKLYPDKWSVVPCSLFANNSDITVSTFSYTPH